MRGWAIVMAALVVATRSQAGAVFVDVPIQVTTQTLAYSASQQVSGPPPTTLVWSGSRGGVTSSGTASASTGPSGELVFDFSVTASAATSGGVGVEGVHAASLTVPDLGPGTTTLAITLDFQKTEQGLTQTEMVASLGYVSDFGLLSGEDGIDSQVLAARLPEELAVDAGYGSLPTAELRSFIAGDVLTFDISSHMQARVPAGVAGATATATGVLRVRAVASDTDADTLADHTDNCSAVANADQLDTDGDRIGNACDCDFDNDGACSIADFNAFLPDFLASVDGGTGTDMDGDGTVGIGDFNLFLRGFAAGRPGPSGLLLTPRPGPVATRDGTPSKTG